MSPRQQRNGGPPVVGPITECHQFPVVAHHTDVQLIAGGPLASLFAGSGPPVGHQWQIPPSDCRRCATGGPPVAFLPLIATAWWTAGVMLSGQCPVMSRFLYASGQRKWECPGYPEMHHTKTHCNCKGFPSAVKVFPC